MSFAEFANTVERAGDFAPFDIATFIRTNSFPYRFGSNDQILARSGYDIREPDVADRLLDPTIIARLQQPKLLNQLEQITGEPIERIKVLPTKYGRYEQVNILDLGQTSVVLTTPRSVSAETPTQDQLIQAFIGSHTALQLAHHNLGDQIDLPIAKSLLLDTTDIIPFALMEYVADHEEMNIITDPDKQDPNFLSIPTPVRFGRNIVEPGEYKRILMNNSIESKAKFLSYILTKTIETRTQMVLSTLFSTNYTVAGYNPLSPLINAGDFMLNVDYPTADISLKAITYRGGAAPIYSLDYLVYTLLNQIEHIVSPQLRKTLLTHQIPMQLPMRNLWVKNIVLATAINMQASLEQIDASYLTLLNSFTGDIDPYEVIDPYSNAAINHLAKFFVQNPIPVDKKGLLY